MPHTVAAKNLEYLFGVPITRVRICLGLYRGHSIRLQTFKKCLGASRGRYSKGWRSRKRLPRFSELSLLGVFE